MKISPGNYPELNLPERWKQEFNSLMATGLYNQTEATNQIAISHHVSSATVYREIYPAKKRKYKKEPSRKWANQITQPGFSREKYRERKRKYLNFRNHFPEYLNQAVAELPDESFEISDLALKLSEITDINVRPPTVLSLSKYFESQNGESLLIEVPGDNLSYRLNDSVNHSQNQSS